MRRVDSSNRFLSRDRVMQLLGLAVGLALAMPVAAPGASDDAPASPVPEISIGE